MQWDVGFVGLAVLALVSLGFGLVAQLVIGRHAGRWIWLAAGAAYFVLGLVISEVWFGWATEEELQPNIDGLSFDEVLLGVIPGLIVVLVIRHFVRRRTRPPRHATLTS
jgi:multisubunit Na+/H+ antiporter MnhE subunit